MLTQASEPEVATYAQSRSPWCQTENIKELCNNHPLEVDKFCEVMPKLILMQLSQ